MEIFEYPKKQLQGYRDEIGSFKAKINKIENIEEMAEKNEGIDER